MRDTKYLINIYYRKSDRYPEKFEYADSIDEMERTCTPYALKGFYCTYTDRYGNERPVFADGGTFKFRESRGRRNRSRRFMREEFESTLDKELKLAGYTVGAHGAYKEFPCTGKYQDVVVFIFDDGRVQFDTGSGQTDIAMHHDKRAVNTVTTARDLKKLNKFVIDFMTDYGLIDDGMEVDVSGEAEDDYDDDFQESIRRFRRRRR